MLRLYASIEDENALEGVSQSDEVSTKRCDSEVTTTILGLVDLDMSVFRRLAR